MIEVVIYLGVITGKFLEHWLNFRPVQNCFRVVKRMKRTMVKLARGDKKLRLGGERFLHGKS